MFNVKPDTPAAIEDTEPTLEPILPRPRPVERPTYLIIEWVALAGPSKYQDCGPELVETHDYLTFYEAGRRDPRPLPMLGYEIVHRYRRDTSFLSARAHYISWRSTMWRKPLLEKAAMLMAAWGGWHMLDDLLSTGVPTVF